MTSEALGEKQVNVIQHATRNSCFSRSGRNYW